MKEKSRKSDMASLSLRLIAGIYLLYTDYSILSDRENIKQSNRFIITLAVILFAVAGILLIAFSAREMIRIRNHPQTDQENDETANIQEEKNDAETDNK